MPSATGPSDDDADRVDSELRRLFADSRLDVAPRPGAGDTVVAGARRIRRRRAAYTGAGAVATIVALVLGAVLVPPVLRGGGQHAATPAGGRADHASRAVSTAISARQLPTSLPIRQTPPTTGSAVRAPPASPLVSTLAPPSPATLTPLGFGKLGLGMAYRQAMATGMLVAPADEVRKRGSCGRYQFAVRGGGIKSVVLSADPAVGIVRIHAGTARTPSGVGVGTPVRKLRAAYPRITRDSATYSVSTGSRSRYVFHVANGVVTEFQLVSTNAPC